MLTHTLPCYPRATRTAPHPSHRAALFTKKLGVLLALFYMTMRRAPFALFPTVAVLMLEQSVSVDMLDEIDQW